VFAAFLVERLKRDRNRIEDTTVLEQDTLGRRSGLL
jgi:hypothetical protein